MDTAPSRRPRKRARPPRCHSCGRRAGAENGSCPRCGAPQLGICDCGASYPVYADRCESCGAAQIPKRYLRRISPRYRVLLVLLLLGLAGYALYRVVPRDPLKEREIRRAEILRDIGNHRYSAARLRCEEYLREWPDDAEVLGLLGEAYMEPGKERLADAEEALRKALGIAPNLLRPREALGRLLLGRGDRAGALEVLRPAIGLDPPRRIAEYVTGYILATDPGCRDPDRALLHLRTALRGTTSGFDRWEFLARFSLGILERSPERAVDSELIADLTAARALAEGELAKTDPEDPEKRRQLTLFLARCDFALGEPREAYAKLRSLQKSEPFRAPERRLLFARVLWAVGNGSRAIEIVRDLAGGEHPVEIWARLIGFAERAGNPELASLAIRRAREQLPEDPDVAAATARLMLAEGDFSGAEAEAGRLLEAHPDHEGLLLADARAIHGQPGREDEAELLLEQNAERLGSSSLLWLELAERLLATPSDSPQVAERLARAERILTGPEKKGGAGGDAERWRRVLRGKLHLRAGRFRLAVDDLESVVSGAPGSADPALAELRPLLARAYGALGNFEREVAQLNVAIGSLGPSPELLRQRADALLRLGAADLAERDCHRLLAQDPDDPIALRLLARARLAAEDPDLRAAVDALSRAAEQPSADPGVRLELAEALRRLGRTEQADAQIALAFERARTFEERAALASRLAGIRSEDGGRPFRGRALEALRELRTERPDNVPLLLTVAVLEVQEGRAEKGIELCRRVLELRPESLAARRILFERAASGPEATGEERSEAARLAAEVARIRPGGFTDLYMRGRLALLRKDFEEAVESLTAAQNLEPQNRSAAFFLAASLYSSGEFLRAKGALDPLERSDPADEEIRRLGSAIRMELARKRLEEGDPASAVALLERAMAREPDLPGARMLLARSYFAGASSGSETELAAARKACEEAIRDLEAREGPSRDAELAGALVLVGDIAFRQGDLDRLLQACEAFLRLRPEDPLARIRMGLARLAREELDEAVEELRAAVGMVPDRLGARDLLAQVLVLEGEPEQALAEIDAWMADHPEDPAALAIRGRLLAGLGRSRDAEDAFRASLERDPDRLESLVGVFGLLESEGAFEDAAATMRRLLPRTVLKGDVMLLLGRSLLATDPHSEEALEILVAAEKAGVRYPLYQADLCLLLVRTYSDRRAYAEAARTGERFELMRLGLPQPQSDPRWARLSSEISFRTGVARQSLLETDRAEQLYRKAVELDPNHVAALNNLASLLGDAVETLPEAVALAERATALAPDLPEVWDTLAQLERRRGNAAAAAQAAEKAVALFLKRVASGGAALGRGSADSQLARYYLHLAEARREAGDPGARSALEEAGRIHPPIRDQEEYRRLAGKLR